MKKRILNLGCGKSHYGTDFIDMYPMRKEVVKCNISKERLPYKDNTFDRVFSSFVFEHLTNPEFTLREMYRVLKKGGVVEIHTNNAGWIFYHNSKSSVLTHYGGYEAAKEKDLHEEGGDNDGHYALYTTHHMKSHMKNVGFKKCKATLYRRNEETWNKGIRIINWILEHSRFKWASYPQIKAEGKKE